MDDAQLLFVVTWALRAVEPGKTDGAPSETEIQSAIAAIGKRLASATPLEKLAAALSGVARCTCGGNIDGWLCDQVEKTLGIEPFHP